MRKLAPVFVLTSIVALTSGSALALGDRNKEKKSPNADTTATQSSTYSSPSSSSASNPSGTSSSGMSGSASTGAGATGAASSTGNGSSLGASGASTNGASKADSTHGATVSSTARDKPTDGSAVSSVAKSNKEACKGLSKSDPAYAANQCDQLVKKGDKQAAAGATSSSGSGK